MGRSVCEVCIYMIVPATTQANRVYVIEPQPLMARAICAVLSEDPAVAVAGTNTELDTQHLQAAAPDIIVIDCDHDMSSLPALIVQCRRILPSIRVCILTMNLSADLMMQALSAGANGYVVKDVTPDALLASIHALGNDGFYADPRLSALLLKRNVERTPSDLSPRELDVVRLIGQGLSNKEIGTRLMLSDKTVKNHVANIFVKLNVNARTQVAIYALRNGII